MSLRRSSASRDPPLASGMEAFDQLLIADLDVGNSAGDGEIEDGERLPVRGQPPAQLAILPRLVAAAPMAVAEQPEIVAPLVDFGARGAVAAEAPCRPVPGHVALEEALDLRFVHAVEEVPCRVVLAHMLEAEPVVVVQGAARLGRAMRTLPVAARMLAATDLDQRFVLEVPIQVRDIIVAHWESIGARPGAGKRRRGREVGPAKAPPAGGG